MRVKTFLLILVFISCSTLSGFGQKRLIPLEFTSSQNPDTYSVIQSKGITVFAECLEVRRDLLVFDIEVRNESGRSLFISPDQFYYYGADYHFPDIEEQDWEYGYTHPEFAKSRGSAESYYIKKIHTRENTKKLLAILGTGMMIYDAVKDGQDFRWEPSRGRVLKSVIRDITLASSLTAIDIASGELTRDQIQSGEDLHYLHEETLISTTIENGDSIRGKVFFAQDRPFDHYRLLIPLEEEWFVFDFRWPTYDEILVISR